MHSEVNSFSREISRHFDSYFEEYDLATSYVELILIMFTQENLTQNDLAEWMNLAPSTITRFINKLAKKGIVEKSKEGRTALISLTAHGKELAEKLDRGYKKAVFDLEKILSKKYVHTTKRLLQHGTELLKE